LAREEPAVEVRPLPVRHEQALEHVRRVGARRLVLFIGSSIGNLDDEDAEELLSHVRASMSSGGYLLVGADRVKDVSALLRAYDDAKGITALFNKNVLARINKELGGQFDLDTFAHRVRWNGGASAVEMHLESLVKQRVRIEGLGATVSFAKGEGIHTESSVKYDDAHLRRIVEPAGFALERSFLDERRWYGVHLYRSA
jgi:uncharacterized SAM-dependent methyltransferase